MGGIDVADNCKSSIPPIGEECVRSTGWKLGYSRYARYVYCMIVLIDFRPLPTLSDSRSLPEPRYEFLKLRLVLLPRCSHSEQFCLDIIEITEEEEGKEKEEEEEEGKEKKEEEKEKNNIDLTSRHFKIHLYLFERKEKGRGWFENYRGKNCRETLFRRRIVLRFVAILFRKGEIEKGKNSRMESQLYTIEQISNIRRDVECMNW